MSPFLETEVSSHRTFRDFRVAAGLRFTSSVALTKEEDSLRTLRDEVRMRGWIECVARRGMECSAGARWLTRPSRLRSTRDYFFLPLPLPAPPPPVPLPLVPPPVLKDQTLLEALPAPFFATTFQ